MGEDYRKFLSTIKDLKPYFIEFKEDGSMKIPEYLDDCTVGRDKRCLVIVITHNECTFLANNGSWKAWTQIRDIFLWPKKKSQDIMAFRFLVLFGWLNFFSLSKEKKKEVIDKTGLIVIKAVELFEYKKSNESYWDWLKFYKQVVNKVLFIAEVLYPDYLLLFFLNNVTSYFVFA